MKLIFYLLAAILLVSSLDASAQKRKPGNQAVIIPQTDSLIHYEKKLKILGDSILDGSNEAIRIQATQQYIPLLVKTLQFNGSFDYPFDSLKFMKKLTPHDKEFRIYNWNLSLDDGTFRYYGAIQMNNTEKFTLYPLFDLFDRKSEMGDLSEATLTHQQWYGAQYYQLIHNRHRRNDYYTLLGWVGNNNISTKKIIEVLTFEEGKPRFGAPIINVNDTMYHRYLFEFSNEAVMLLRYEADHNIIVHDHLVPPNASSKGHKFTYIPDGTYDYFIYQRGNWVRKEQLFDTYRKKIGND